MCQIEKLEVKFTKLFLKKLERKNTNFFHYQSQSDHYMQGVFSDKLKSNYKKIFFLGLNMS